MPKQRVQRVIDQRAAAQVVAYTGASGGGAVTVNSDHGALSGLGDDDHLQYLNNARGDARYPLLTTYNAHVANPDAHHARVHAYDSSDDHTGTLSWAKVNKSGASLADLPTRLYADLQSRTHSVTGADHSIAAAQYGVVGATALNTLGILTPSADVSGGETALLRSAAGLLTLKNLMVATLLQTDSVNMALGVNVTPDGAAALDVRSGATSDHTVRIKQIASQTGRLWRVENTSGQELIVLDSVGNLQSGDPGFFSGLTGWQVTPVGNAEFNNGTFRGELRASVFAIEEIHASPGTLLVTPSAGKVRTDVTLTSTGTTDLMSVRTTAFADQTYLDYRTDSSTGSGTGITARLVENILAIDDPESGHAQLFDAGDILQFKAFTGSGVASVWMRVNAARNDTTHYSYFVQVMSGTLPVTLRAGVAVVAHGQPGQGAIKLTADGAYTPRLDVYTIGDEPWNGEVYPHLAAGRLDGVGVPGLSGIEQYGVALGEDLSDANAPYLYASNLGVRQYRISSEWHDGANTTARIDANGRAQFGSNVDSPAATFLDINPATGTATFRGALEVMSATGYSNFSDKPALGALAAGSTLDDVPNGTTYARTNSTIISGGNIRVGSGTKDSTLDGWHIDATEIVGQLDGVDQVVMGTDGTIKGGGGVASLSALGFMIDVTTSGTLQRTYSLRDGSNVYGGLGGWSNTGTPGDNVIILLADTTGSRAPRVDIWADGAGSYPGTVRLLAGGSTSLWVEESTDRVTFNASRLVWGTDDLIAARTTAW